MILGMTAGAPIRDASQTSDRGYARTYKYIHTYAKIIDLPLSRALHRGQATVHYKYNKKSSSEIADPNQADKAKHRPTAI